MFNKENIEQAKQMFAEKRYCHIDNVLEPKYIQALYEAVPKIDYGVWTCIHLYYGLSFMITKKRAL